MDTNSTQFQKIIEMSAKIEDVAKGANTFLAPVMIRDFIVAMDITNDLLAKAIREDLKTSAAVKEAEAIAYFDKAPDYLKSKGVKESSEAKKMYVNMDPDVVNALNSKAKTEAMVVFLKNKLQEFRMAHDSVKKIAYSSDYNNTPNEGM